MTDRRNFLKSALVVAAGMSIGATKAQAASGPYPTGIIYTADDPGQWEKKVGSHAPVVTMDGMKATVQTKHPMSADHYIVRHTVVSADGKVIDAQVFTPDMKPMSSYTLPGKGEYYATSFCNLHDFWVTKFSV